MCLDILAQILNNAAVFARRNRVARNELFDKPNNSKNKLDGVKKAKTCLLGKDS